MIRYGILGTANIARTFAREKSINAEITAIASRNIDKAKTFAKEFNIPETYSSYEELIDDENIDAVYIPLPHHLHHEYTIRCALAGKHVLCEKPAALNVREIEEMTDACRKHGVFFMEAFMYRFLPIHQRVKEFVKSGAIGRLRYIDFNFCIDIQSKFEGTFRWNKSLGGGALFDLGIYGISLSRYMTDQEPTVIHSLAHRDHPDAIDKFSMATLQLGDVVAHITSSFFTHAYYYTLSGDKGIIHVPTGTTGKMFENKLILKMQGESEEHVETFKPVNGYKAEAEYFARCIERGEEPLLNGDESRKNLKVVEKIFEKETPLVLGSE
ncbi:MAG: Gfo/Idh/MocA family oxidoreductase [bacterium]